LAVFAPAAKPDQDIARLPISLDDRGAAAPFRARP